MAGGVDAVLGQTGGVVRDGLVHPVIDAVVLQLLGLTVDYQGPLCAS